MRAAVNNPWRVVEWTDANRRTVKELAFHESETQEVLNLPMPLEAVVREPVMMLTDLMRQKPYSWHRKRWPECETLPTDGRPTHCFRRGRLLVQLDRRQVFPDDPGAGTPAIIRCFQFSSTYWCGLDNGLEGPDGRHLDLTPDEVDWLMSLEPDITSFLYR